VWRARGGQVRVRTSLSMSRSADRKLFRRTTTGLGTLGPPPPAELTQRLSERRSFFMPPHLFLQRAEKVLTRRLFMKGLAAGLSIPAALRFSRRATAAPSAGAKRFLLFYTPHGMPPEHFEPRL